MAKAYYNENNKFAADWLRNLISEGLIADGDVDNRSIKDVEASDLDGYTQAHFFSGIGGWSLALRMAGWPDDRPVWTGSCPCQPFSNAGSRKGTDDERHLFPVWRELIAQCKPSTIFGEQVASKAGRAWLGSVLDSLEALGYAGAGADLGAASVNAPQIRQRLWWVGNSNDTGLEGWGVLPERADQRASGPSGLEGRLADNDKSGCNRFPQRQQQPEAGKQASRGDDSHRCGLGDPWADHTWVLCSDGRARPIPAAQPALFPLAHGLPGRVGVLRGSGNAIVPQVAAQFVGAYMDTLNA